MSDLTHPPLARATPLERATCALPVRAAGVLPCTDQA
jgi:hypothetical protein